MERSEFTRPGSTLWCLVEQSGHREENGHRRDHEEYGEHEEEQPIYDHGCELPVSRGLVVGVVLLHAGGDELQFVQDGRHLAVQL